MTLIDYDGVAMLMLDADEALDDRWRARSGLAEVVRVERPPVECWPQLRARGFLPKPQWIMWLADVCADEETFIARLSSGERQKIRLARHKLGEQGLRLEVRPVDAALFGLCRPKPRGNCCARLTIRRSTPRRARGAPIRHRATTPSRAAPSPVTCVSLGQDWACRATGPPGQADCLHGGPRPQVRQSPEAQRGSAA